jgi:hypothetical protein
MFSVRKARGDEKLRQLAKLARRLPRPGIIYCSTTKTVEDIWLALRLIKVPCARYHGKMTDKDRAEHQARFMKKGKRIVMVATSAFGLGIDKPDIRYIVHFQAPASLERYLQEAGRAGRDGHAARCILLFDDSDLEIQEHLLALSRLSPALLGRFGRALAAWAGEERDANIEELALSAGVSQRAASSLVTVLVEAGICERVDGQRVHPLVPLETLVERVEGLRTRFEVLRREDARRMRAIVDYANEEGCRSVALRRYFGDEDPTPCGRCDLCRIHGVMPPGRSARFDRHRRHRERRPWPRPVGEVAAAEGAAPAGDGGRHERPERMDRQDRQDRMDRMDRPERRRRRRRRRGGRGRQQGEAPRPMAAGAAAPPPPAALPLPPLDAAAEDLAAELGAPGLPPEPAAAGSRQPVDPARPAHHHRRRRRRRRRGPGPRPEAGPPPDSQA